MNAVHKYAILENHQEIERKISINKAEAIKDDPFGLGFTVKGLATVNHQSNLSNYAEELVTTYARYSCDQYHLSLDMLPDDEQNELARLYIEAHNREVNECIYGEDFSINNEFTCALLSMLKNDCKETRDHFAEVTQKNTLLYFKDALDETLSSACKNYLFAVNDDNGYFAQQDLEHDEYCWRKF